MFAIWHKWQLFSILPMGLGPSTGSHMPKLQKKRWSYFHEALDWEKGKIPQKYFVSIFWIFHFKQFGTLDSAIGPSLWIIKSLYQTQLLTSYQKSFFLCKHFLINFMPNKNWQIFHGCDEINKFAYIFLQQTCDC